jgi:hypothetical protein
METQSVFEYITAESNNYKTVRVPITDSVSWNMPEHIERCTNVANGWYHSGKNDGLRPYRDIVTPIINVARRSEGFDVKDIVPFVNQIQNSYKSFLVKTYHPKWARKNELDTFIDEVVESSIIYDLALVKKSNSVRPELIPLQKIAFCDQTDIMAGPICIRHQFTPADLVRMKGKWNAEKIDEAITLSLAEKTQPNNNQSKVKTPGKYIEVYELRGNLPNWWLTGEIGDNFYEYTHQMHIVCFYVNANGEKQGITLFKGKDKPLADNFKTLVIQPVFGRACGKSIVETLFEPQVWANYSEQKIKALLDSAVTLFQTDSEDLAGQKLSQLANNTIIKHEQGKPLSKVDGTLQNLPAFTNYQQGLETSARILGSASEAQLGTNPVSGTPFALQSLVVQQGQGIHEFRQGKIATFFADVLYRDWILQMLVDDMNGGVTFSEELSLDELNEIADNIVENEVNEKINKMVLEKGTVPTEQDREVMREVERSEFMKAGSRRFMEIIQGELEEIPMDVMVNIKGKQRSMAENADKLSNIFRIITSGALQQVPGISKLFNEIIEESGFSPIDFASITKASPIQPTQAPPVEALTQ